MTRLYDERLVKIWRDNIPVENLRDVRKENGATYSLVQTGGTA